MGQIWLVTTFVNKFYWDTAIPIALCVVYGCSHTVMAELRGHGTDDRVCRVQGINSKYICRKRFPIPVLDTSPEWMRVMRTVAEQVGRYVYGILQIKEESPIG